MILDMEVLSLFPAPDLSHRDMDHSPGDGEQGNDSVLVAVEM